MDSTQNLIVAIGGGGVGTIGGFVVGFEGTGQFAETVVGAAKDVFGAHPFVGRAVSVEIGHEGLGQRVVLQRNVRAVLLFQFCQQATLLLPAATAEEETQCP